MNTLVTSHDGLSRMVRGVRALTGLLSGHTARPAGRGHFASFVSRMIERAQQHRQDRVFEQLMRDDPRVYADLQAAAARQNRQA